MSRALLARTGLLVWVTVAASGCRHPTSPDPPPCYCGPAQSEAELINRLKVAYQKRDYDAFEQLFRPDYLFYLNVPQDDGTTSWGLTEELRIHRRMFHPQDAVPPVPPELWIVSIDITLVARAPFQDPCEYYCDPAMPWAFDREKFTVTQADYAVSIFFQTAGQTHYRVDGFVNFVVVNDLSKAKGDDAKYLIYRWQDLGTTALSTTSNTSWSGVKLLYR